MRKLTTLILVLLMISPGLTWAQSDPVPTATPTASHSKKKHKTKVVTKTSFTPIDVQQQTFPYYDSTTGWSELTATSFYYQGKLLCKPKDYERIIYPLNDPTANDYLRSAAENSGWGTGLIIGSSVVEIAGWTDFVIVMLDSGSPNSNPSFLPCTVMILGGVGLFVKGVFNGLDAENDRSSAVYRYNDVLKNGPNVSLGVMPDNKTLGFGLTQTF